MSVTTNGIFQFGEFQIDGRARTLRREEAIVPLNFRAFDVLLYFVQNSGKVLTRDELLKNVWRDAFVDENNLAQSISALRRALAEKPGENNYIVTLPGRGYQFVAAVKAVTPDVLAQGIVATANEDPSHELPTTANDPTGGIVFQQQTIRTRVVTQGIVQHENEARNSTHSPSRVARIVAPLAMATTLAAVAVGGGAWYWRSNRAPKLTEKDTIVVADFDNRTGDPVFDDTLKRALTVGLDQSPYLNVVSDQKIGEGLKLMDRDPGQRFTGEVARDLCQRVRGNALLQGSIASLGSQYVVVLTVTNCATGNSLESEEVRAESKEKILPALDKAASNLRGKLGESVGSIEKYDIPMEQATTPLLAALQAYSAGVNAWANQGNEAAIPFYKRAIELDPSFAMAYARLGQAYDSQNVQAAGIENSKKSFALRDRVSERERFFIDSRYYDIVTGESEEEVRVLEQWRQVYPREPYPDRALAYVFRYLGRYEDSLRAARDLVRLEPDAKNNTEMLVNALVALNRFDEAQATLEGRNPDEMGQVYQRYLLAFLRGDATGIEKQAARMAKNPNGNYLSLLADMEAYHGRLRRATELNQQAMELDISDKWSTASPEGFKVKSAIQGALFGYPEQARRHGPAAQALSKNTGVQIFSAMALALVGESARPEAIAADMAKQNPLDTLVNFYVVPTIRATIHLRHNNPADAVRDLEVTARYELQATSIPPLLAVYVRGQAFLAMHQGWEAAAEFQKFIDHPGMVGLHPIGAVARVELARAYAMQGDTVKARAAYQDFFSLWKDADPEVPILKAARTEYSKLQ